MSVNLRAVDLNLLPIFDVLITEQHLSRAAERLAMSQPAVSNALKRLRHCFNDELFVRTARGLKPTPRAMDLHASFQPALAMIQAGCVDIPFQPSESHQCLKMTMNAATEYLLMPMLAPWLSLQAPHMQLKIFPDYLDDIPRLLKEGGLDFAVDFIEHDPDQFHHIVLAEEALTVICAKQHHVIDGAISLEEFETLPQVTVTPRSNLPQGQDKRKGTPIEQLMGRDVPQRFLSMYVSSFVAIPDIVAQSQLIAVVPSRLVRESYLHDRLQCLPLPFDYPAAKIRLFWHKSRQTDPGHRWFRESVSTMVNN